MDIVTDPTVTIFVVHNVVSVVHRDVIVVTVFGLPNVAEIDVAVIDVDVIDVDTVSTLVVKLVPV